jgi:phosphonoacetate hydrolase
LSGIDLVLEKADACVRFGLPPDRTGDLVAISGGPNKSKVIGTSAKAHDLSGLDVPLRSHGGLTEQRVPFFINSPVSALPDGLRNFDAFFVGCNSVEYS